ncbi:hypothetical protein ABE473_17110 [Stenotrophomonas sp. TWI700]|uniref:hypothetical protein n=1 Tax=Stenotrophomonas sp. TWI700 TaxID=3136792 RepID=UPI00320AD00A
MTLLTRFEYSKKAMVHMQWMRWVFGLTTFLLAVTALGFDSPWRVGWLGLAAIIPMYVHAFTGHPEELRELRKLARDHTDPGHAEAQAVLKAIESEFHGLRAVAQLAILWVGLLVYLAICFSFAEPFDAILWFAT